MRLADRSDYALRVLMYLAACQQQATVAEMATLFQVSQHHLVKVVQRLAACGFVKTTRGRGGGVCLAREPSRIRIGEVVRHTEPDMGLVECFRAGGSCPLERHCRLASLLRRAMSAFIDELNGSTLADLVAGRTQLLQLLDNERKVLTRHG